MYCQYYVIYQRLLFDENFMEIPRMWFIDHNHSLLRVFVVGPRGGLS